MISWLKTNYHKILLILVLFLTFLYLVYPYSDYDWGWHLRYGEFFIKTGQIMRSDIFSWTLPNYQWTNHSWLYDPFLYLSYTKLGFTGLSFIGAAISLLIFVISSFQHKLNYWQLGILALFFTKIPQTTLEEGVRSQHFGLLLLSILILVLIKARENKKILYLIPPLFLIWANVHGSFTLGFCILAIFIASSLLTKSTDNFPSLLKVTFLSFFLTLLNPFGYRIYLVSLKHFFSPWLSNVIEWLPPTFSCGPCNLPYFILFLLFLTIVFILRKKKSDLPFIILLSFLTVESFLHRRYLSMFIVVGLPIAAMFLKEIKFNLEKFRVTALIFIVFTVILLEKGLFVRLSKYNLFKYSLDDYCRFSTNCSTKLAEFLIANPPKGKGLNFYDWGGFFIGLGVKSKFFIDGRMHLWSIKGYQPFADYINIYYRKDKELFDSYNFDWIIARNDSPLLQEVTKNPYIWGNWKIVYSDDAYSYMIRLR